MVISAIVSGVLAGMAVIQGIPEGPITPYTQRVAIIAGLAIALKDVQAYLAQGPIEAAKEVTEEKKLIHG